MTPISIRLAVFDWAGTTVDFGCFAPVAAFIESFARHGVTVTAAQARVPMGLHKRDHIIAMLHLQEVRDVWRAVHQRDWNDSDVDSLFTAFIPLQLEVVGRYSSLIPGTVDAVAELRRHGIKIGSTTGYFREAAQIVRDSAARNGYIPDCSLIPEDARAGRPYPWMIFRIMEALNVYPPAAVVKVGDTIPDMEEARAAGAWAVGVSMTSSEIGLTEREFAALSVDEQERRLGTVSETLKKAGAHLVIRSVADMPACIHELNARLHRGERPD